MKAMRNDTGCKREEWNCRNHREGGGIAAMVLNAWKGHLLTRRQREQLYVLEPRFFAGQDWQVFLHSTILSHLVTSCHILSFCRFGFRFPLPKVIASAMSAACLALLLLVHHTQVQYSYHKSRMEILRSKLKKNGKRLSRVRYFTKWKGSKSKHDVNLM